MQIIFHETEKATDILNQAQALLSYQNALLADFGDGGSVLDQEDAFGAVTLNRLLSAMLQAAIERQQPAKPQAAASGLVDRVDDAKPDTRLTESDREALIGGFNDLAARIQDTQFALECLGSEYLGPDVGRMIDRPTCTDGMTYPSRAVAK
jgi:hypothetical protein